MKEWSITCKRRLIVMHIVTRVTAWHGRSRIHIDYIDDMRIYKHPRTCHLNTVNKKVKVRVITVEKKILFANLIINVHKLIINSGKIIIYL